ncbi:predicted protein [Nematostella vectensis]|uniref:Uncharacterized protein n=1 Tax=Nematostella vectensis TaxID=45351 RepID=A7RH47_NEMVE|nr:uncharacterized protein LOC5521565 [Nematostella vectensis]EDO49159.1 predicted protein [Nematostella vectensis]|eukprot:XP_001641222.1 predicted protein [Nematostella vectensis]
MAFLPRSRKTFGIPVRRQPVPEVLMDTRSFVRQAPCLLPHRTTNTVQQRLWLDITELDTTNIEHKDEQYNSNMWKNFKFVRSKQSAAESSKTLSPQPKERILKQGDARLIDMETDHHVRGNIADIYPLKVPHPSRIGDNTYDKFLGEAKLTERKRNRIARQLQNSQDFRIRQMKIRSECRAPPLNWEGEIVPPQTFRRYPHRFNYDQEEDEQKLSYSYVSKNTRPYTGSPGSEYQRYGTPWKDGLRGRKPPP